MSESSTSHALPAARLSRSLRIGGVLLSLAALLVLLALRGQAGGLPRHDLLFGLVVYLIGPAVISLAAITFLPPRSNWLLPAVVASFLLGAAFFVIVAVNLGAVSP